VVPIRTKGTRADDKGTLALPSLAKSPNRKNCLDGFPQAHFICEQSSFGLGKKRHTVPLVGPQWKRQFRRDRDRVVTIAIETRHVHGVRRKWAEII
jgi:hypothetical protein